MRQYAAHMSGLSRAQVTRLIGQYGGCGEVKAAQYRRHRFASRFTSSDITLLASVDEAHGDAQRPGDEAHPGARISGVREGRV
ncbi:MAG: hypothetical protein M3Y07_13565 [Acidobacteriota bacterium]|nr:hypothetical protein [Acidobacteriota bacterium]